MKSFAAFLSWVLLLAGLAAAIGIATGSFPSTPWPSSQQAALSRPAFADFPVDEPRVIDFDLDEVTTSQLSDREQTDQKRDWLLYTVVTNSGTSADAANRALYDLAPVRHGYLHHVSKFEYGRTRSCVLGEGQVVALVPKAEPKQHADDLAHVFDEARKNLGTLPEELVVFEYAFDNADRATVTRRASVSDKAMIEPQAGYYEAAVRTLADLEKLMGSIDDLVYARSENGVLRIGGRKLAGIPYRNIGVKDVAALWHAEQQIHKAKNDFDKDWNLKVEAFNSTYGPTHPGESQAKRDKAFKHEVQEPYAEARQRLHLVSGSGFSLDPTYDYKGLAEALNKPTLAKIISASGIDETDLQELAAQGVTLQKLLNDAKVPENMLPEAIAALQGHSIQGTATAPLGTVLAQPTPQASARPDELPFLQLIEQCKQLENENDTILDLAAFLERMGTRYRFQAARYDGPLNGTEVGMVLYYTDLMAKIWSQDFANSTPSSAIPDFTPETRTILPAIYRAELIKLPNTRLWFGPEENGYQIVDKHTLHFSRNATRIFAASSNPLRAGVEVAPNASSEAFLTWWNDHYEEVAQYEPEYERLNEIMKWSLLISWLNNAGALQELDALAPVTVDHTAWFPDWARKSPNLKFKDWEEVGFYPRNYLGTTTEAMPILVSYGFNIFAGEESSFPAWSIEGGVSLAEKAIFKERALLRTELPSSMRRSGVDYTNVSAAGEKLTTFRGSSYKFSKPSPNVAGIGGRAVGREVSSVSMEAKTGLKFRARYGELREGSFSRTIEFTSSNTQIKSHAFAGQVGELNIAKSQNGFHVGWKAREIDQGYSLARRLSSSEDFAEVLKFDPLVEEAIADSVPGTFYVKTTGARKWLKIANERTPLPDVEAGWHGRVADLTPQAKPVNVAWVDKVPPELTAKGENWVRGPPKPPINIGAEGPRLPESAGEASRRILSDPAGFKAQLDARFKQHLADIDKLLSSGQSREALGRIQEGIGEFGSHEQFCFREALADLAGLRHDLAADALNSMKLTGRAGSDALLTEINVRLKSATDPAARRIAESVDWRTHPAKPPGDQVVLSATAHGLDHKLQLAKKPADLLVEAKNVSPNALIYHQDTPGLNALDWNASVKASLDQVAGQNLGKIIELPRADIAHFNPAEISLEKARFSRANSARAPKASPANPIAKAYRAWDSTANDDDDETDENGSPRHFKEKVYLVVEP